MVLLITHFKRPLALLRSFQREFRFKLMILIWLIALFTPVNSSALSLEGFEADVEKSMKMWQVPGLAMAIVQDGKLVFSKGFGVRKLGEAAPVDSQTLFAIGSSSKAFTATALAMLVDEGKIDWDTPVVGILPRFRLSDPWVSGILCLRDMLSHRSGLKGADILWIWKENYLNREQILARMQYEPMAFPFRTKWHYNNLMFLAAGQMIPALTGVSWDKFIQKRIFAPLGMKSSNTSIRQLSGQKNLAAPHVLENGKVEPIKYRSVDMMAPAGAINSNITDMSKWLRFQLAGCVWKGKTMVKPKTVNQMRSPQISMPIPYPTEALPGAHFLGYGLAWFLQDYQGIKVVHHGGNIDGMTALVALVPEKDFGFVILSNLDCTRLRDVLMYELLDRLLGRRQADWNGYFMALEKKDRAAVQEGILKRRKARKKDTKPSLALKDFCGEYEHPYFGKVQISLKKGSLCYRYQTKEVGLSHWHYNSFQRPNWSIEEPGIELVTFELDSNGKASFMVDESMARFSRAVNK